MEALKPGNSETGQLERDLEYLLGAFGTSVSLEDIASAYSKSQHDVSTAAEILCNLQGCTSSTSPTNVVQNSGIEVPIKSDIEIGSNPATNGEKDYFIKPKQKKKKCSISIGTVSSMMTRDYSQHRPSRNASTSEVAKPLKLICYEPPVNGMWDGKPPLGDSAKNGFLHKDDEVIHLQRLGDESQPERYVGLSGNILHKSMEKQFPEKLQNADPTNGDKERLMIEREKEKENERKKLSMVLEQLFSLSKRFEPPPKITLPTRQEKISRGPGYVVSGPPEDVQPTYNKTVTVKQQIIKNEEDEDSYEVMRQAFQEHSITMKEYYKSAAEAQAIGDHLRADKMLEEGNFFKRKAQEANERSAEMCIQGEDKEDLLVDLSELEPEESIPFLKIQLNHLHSLPTFQYINIKLGSCTEDRKGEKKKRLVKKLLEKRSIKWTEESDGEVIAVLLEDVSKSLSLAKRKIHIDR